MPFPVATRSRVPSAGLELAVRQYGEPVAGRLSLVLVHGYPDQQDMWDRLVAELPLDEVHVVTYDVRGAGDSGVPETVDGYHSTLLVEDLVAVLDATLPDGGRAHLVGHDWGSVQLWDAVAAEATHPGLRGRLASFTSISGPSLDHSAWVARHPRGRELALLKQAARSWYVYAFQVPRLPELAWRHGTDLVRRAARAQGADHLGPELARNAVNGVDLYRANVPRRLARAGDLRTDVPVLVVHPTRDRFLTGVLNEDLTRACSDVRLVEVDGPHWVPRTHPREVATLVMEQVRRTEPTA